MIVLLVVLSCFLVVPSSLAGEFRPEARVCVARPEEHVGMCLSPLVSGTVRCTFVHKTTLQSMIIHDLLRGGVFTFLPNISGGNETKLSEKPEADSDRRRVFASRGPRSMSACVDIVLPYTPAVPSCLGFRVRSEGKGSFVNSRTKLRHANEENQTTRESTSP